MSEPPDSEPPKLFAGMNARRVKEIAARARCQLALGDDPRYRWLCDRSEVEGCKPTRWQPALLTELGRLLEEQGKEAMLSLAERLCAVQPPTREGLAMIRQARLARSGDETLALASRLMELVQREVGCRPEVRPRQIISALESVIFYLSAEDETPGA